MITAFLFFSKILDSRSNPIDWAALFVSRVCRLVPLYSVFVVLVLGLVVYLSGGRLTEPITTVANATFRWLGFTILGRPRINGIDITGPIAGVTWSLRYEWYFYLSLPVLSVLAGRVPPRPYLLLSAGCVLLAAVVSVFVWRPNYHFAFAFAVGIVAAVLARSQRFQKLAPSVVASFLVASCLAAAVAFFPSAYDEPPLFLLGVAFCLVASGNSLFGVLLSRGSRALGESAYSIYLLHSLFLYVTFTIILDSSWCRSLSAAEHWGVVLLVAPVLLLGSHWTFRLIEMPGIKSAPRFTVWLRGLVRNHATRSRNGARQHTAIAS
jgi:peptidoglycan/LPS O-acetylase OafA/YrhL